MLALGVITLYALFAFLSIPLCGWAMAKLDDKVWSEDEARYLLRWCCVWPLFWLLLIAFFIIIYSEPAVKSVANWLVGFAHRGFRRGAGQ